MRFTRVAAAAGAVILATTLAACGQSTEDTSASGGAEITTIRVGFNSGPYQQEWEEGIAPILEAQGYTVESQEFSDGVQVNVALGQGDIDANIMQHRVYQDFVNEQEGLDNVALVEVPGPPMGLYAGKLASLDDVTEGSSISLPNQPSNLYRALTLLQQLGWVTLSDTIDPGTASLKDVAQNPKNLDLVLMDNAQQVRALEDVDFGVIQGNFAVASDIPLTSALKLETIADEFKVVVSVRAADQDTQWAKDVVAAYHSKEFQDYITSNSIYDGYALPSYFEQ